MKRKKSVEKLQFFDPQEEYDVYYGRLPHWEQLGATYFITFRTADSIPKSVWKLWERERDDWLRRQHINPMSRSWGRELAKLPIETQRRFHCEFANKLELHLDDLHGDLVLKNPDNAKIVAEALHHFDGDRYHLYDFVVMPNHIHVLVGMLGQTRLRKQCYSWKSFTAKRINERIGKSGVFWQNESFDHLVRDFEHLQKFQRYILANPKKANLGSDDFLHYAVEFWK